MKKKYLQNFLFRYVHIRIDKTIELTSPEIVVFTVRNTISGATQIKTKAIKMIDWYKLHFESIFSFAACIL